MKIRITNDLYDISSRIKEIDVGYEIYYDTKKEKYILYLNGKPCITIPYPNLDVRTLDHVYYTRAENIDKVLADIDAYNKRADKECVKKARDTFENEASRQFRLLKI